MDDEDDVRKLTEVLNQYKTQDTLEIDEFINFSESEDSESDVELECETFEIADISQLNTYAPLSTLKASEKCVIDACTDPELKNLLLLNRKKNMQLMHLYKKTKDLLLDCQKEILTTLEIVKNSKKTHASSHNNYVVLGKLCAPYFKDTDLYPCPPNIDVVRKRNNNELSVYELNNSSRKWANTECEKLLRSVKLNYNLNKQKAIGKEITLLKAKICFGKCDEDSELHAELRKLEARLGVLQDMNFTYPPRGCTQHIDWQRISDVFLKNKHTALECETMWNVYLHPDINKSKWSKEETENLKRLAQNYNNQNWAQIAIELNTNRTAFTVCYHYSSTIREHFKRGEFFPDEDQRLLEMVDAYRIGNQIPWSKIVHHFDNRSRSQLFYRYTYYLNTSKTTKRGKFTEAEDTLLLILLQKFGKNYKKWLEYFPNRTRVQLKSHYLSNLITGNNKGTFTIEEDEKIMDHVREHGTGKWSGITRELNRSRGQVRQRHATICRFLSENPEKDISQVPRRKFVSSSCKVDNYNIARYIAEKFQEIDAIPSLNEIEQFANFCPVRPSKESECSPNEDEEDEVVQCRTIIKQGMSKNLDDALADFFCNAMEEVNQKPKFVSDFAQATNDAQCILNQLNVTLELPENYDQHPELDSVDLAILTNLMDKTQPCTSKRKSSVIVPQSKGRITQLVPPNLSTIITLRSLLIKNIQIKTSNQFGIFDNLDLSLKKSSFKLENRFLKSSQYTKRVHVLKERNLFYQRFYSLLTWPSILSLQNPSQNLLVHSQTLAKPLKRTYGKKELLLVPPPKRIKTVEELKQLPMSLKLTPVDKSVVENLMRKNAGGVKLFCLDSVNCNGTQTTVVKQLNSVPGFQVPSTTIEEIAVESAGDIEGDSLENDLEDVRKLDELLKAEKQALNLDCD